MAMITGVGFTLLALGMPVASAQPRPDGGVSLSSSTPSSPGQAGYFVQNPPASASASDRFRAPKLACTSTRSGVGIGSLVITSSGSTSLVTGASLYAQCISGVAHYRAVVEVNGVLKEATFTPARGDVITASVTQTASSATAVLRDETKRQSVSSSARRGAQTTFVIDGVDTLLSNATGLQLPIPNFGSEHFTNGLEDGATIKAAGGFAVDMQTSGGVLQIQTGPLSTTGKAWSETFVHS
jgi:hypothetical protein